MIKFECNIGNIRGYSGILLCLIFKIISTFFAAILCINDKGGQVGQMGFGAHGQLIILDVKNSPPQGGHLTCAAHPHEGIVRTILGTVVRTWWSLDERRIISGLLNVLEFVDLVIIGEVS